MVIVTSIKIFKSLIQVKVIEFDAMVEYMEYLNVKMEIEGNWMMTSCF